MLRCQKYQSTDAEHKNKGKALHGCLRSRDLSLEMAGSKLLLFFKFTGLMTRIHMQDDVRTDVYGMRGSFFV